MKIALVTYQDQGKYNNISVDNEDDQLLNHLSSKGLQLEKVVWDDEKVDWSAYDFILIKSPWDYFDKIDLFYAWLINLKKNGAKVLNPIDTILWNADKHYLKEIESKGLNVTTSIFLSKGDEINLADHLAAFNGKFIVKPTVSGGSKNTFKVQLDNVEEVNLQLKTLLQNEDFIVQPFLKEIEEQGEISFLFFGGKFSHALLKKAKTGDFRVQPMFGGTIHHFTPSPELLTSAQKYVDEFAKNCLYARVDGTIVNGEFLLMELELIEPFLFLDKNTESYENYYQALKTLIN